MARGKLIESCMQTKMFWIQEQAPAGNWVNSVGLDIKTTKDEALLILKQWRQALPEAKYRLAEVTTSPIEG